MLRKQRPPSFTKGGEHFAEDFVRGRVARRSAKPLDLCSDLARLVLQSAFPEPIERHETSSTNGTTDVWVAPDESRVVVSGLGSGMDRGELVGPHRPGRHGCVGVFPPRGTNA